jgi:Mlc titration factor MtfA (ptsG expression regulator)
MKQSHPELPVPETVQELKVLVREKIQRLNIQEAKNDVMPFIKERSELDIWSHDYFNQITDQIKIVS